MIDLQTVKQGTLETLTITWELNSLTTVPASISGAVITAVMYNVDTGATTAVTGTLTATGAAAFTWKLSAGDSGTAGSYLVTFKAVVSGETAYTLNAALNVQGNPAVNAVQNDPLVGVSVAEGAWVTAGRATVPDAADLVDANDIGTAAYADTAAFDAAGAAAAAQAAAIQRANHTGTQLLATISDADTITYLTDEITTYSPVASGINYGVENESSVFAGWGTAIGVLKKSTSITIYVRSWDAGSLISRVRLRIRRGDYTGVVLYDDEVSITPTYNTTQPCVFSLGDGIGDGVSEHWIEFYTNAKCGLNFTDGGTSRGYATSPLTIDAADPSMLNVGASNRKLYFIFQQASTSEIDTNAVMADYTAETVPDTDRVNAANLPRWRRKTAEIEYGDTAIAKVAIIGDSWVNAAYRVTSPLHSRLAAVYGDAGYGWVGASTGEAVPSASVTRVYGGSWTAVDAAAGGVGASMHHIVSAATGATVTFTAVNVTNWKIHYRAQTGGGDFRWQVNGGGWTAVNTAATAAAVVIDAVGAGDLEIEVTAQDTTGVLLLGVEAYKDDTGVIVHKLGNSGATAARWLTANDTKWRQIINNLSLDLVIICLGTNDMSGNVALATYVAQMVAISTRIKTDDPTIDIVFLSPSDNGLTGKTYTMRQYSDALAAYCRKNGESWLDLWRLFGDYTDDNGDTLIDRDMYDDNVHPGLRGGVAIGRLIASLLMA